MGEESKGVYYPTPEELRAIDPGLHSRVKTLVGLENTGFALAQPDELWMEPIDYRAELAEGVNVLTSAGVKVLVY